MDIKYIGGDVPWTLPFGDHFHSSSQASFNDTQQTSLAKASDIEAIARRYEFEPLYSASENQVHTKSPFSNSNIQWMNSGVLFTDKLSTANDSKSDKQDFSDDHGHTFCYLCSINQHHHERTQPRNPSQRRKLIPYNNPKALKSRSASLDRTVQSASTYNSVPYRFIVRTATGTNAGTRAQVYLYMYGTENNWTSINLQPRSNPNSDGFPSGSVRTICLKGPEIGQLTHLNVNLVGARSDKEWFLKEIEITNLDTSVTWLCEFNCWLPKKNEQEYRIKSTNKRKPDISIENLSIYILQVFTGGKNFAGTDSNIHVTIRGSTSGTRQLALTSSHSDLFEQNQLDTFAIVGWDLGDLLEITVESDNTHMASDWDLKEMAMWKIIPSDEKHHSKIYFPCNKWIGTQRSKAKLKSEEYVAIDNQIKGPICYHVAVKTGSAVGAGTDANVFIIIYGKNGRTITHLLDNPYKNDFERNSTSEFNIMDIDVGKINRIKIWHDDTNVGAAWLLDSVIIRKKYSTCSAIAEAFTQRLDKISQVFYRQARDSLMKDHNLRLSSPKDNEQRAGDRRNSKSKDLDDLAGNRGILRSPIVYDRTGLQKKNVRWDEQSIGSQDEPFTIDTQRMKNMQTKIDQKHKRDRSSPLIETGRFEHQAYWISSHTYADNKWKIKSIEEVNKFDLDKSTLALLLSDRTAVSSKTRTPMNATDDDVYEFEAKRWLKKEKDGHGLEIELTPKSVQLSKSTSDEAKSKATTNSKSDLPKKPAMPPTKPLSEIRFDKFNGEDSKRSSKLDSEPLQRSPRSLASLDRSPRDPSKTQLNDSLFSSHLSDQRFSSTSKRQEDLSYDKYQRSASPGLRPISPHGTGSLKTSITHERDILAKSSQDSPYYSRSTPTSSVDPRWTSVGHPQSKLSGSSRDPMSPLTSNRDLSNKTSTESAMRSKQTVYSPIDVSMHKRTPTQNYSSAYDRRPIDDITNNSYK